MQVIISQLLLFSTFSTFYNSMLLSRTGKHGPDTRYGHNDLCCLGPFIASLSVVGHCTLVTEFLIPTLAQDLILSLKIILVMHSWKLYFTRHTSCCHSFTSTRISSKYHMQLWHIMFCSYFFNSLFIKGCSSWKNVNFFLQLFLSMNKTRRLWSFSAVKFNSKTLINKNEQEWAKMKSEGL